MDTTVTIVEGIQQTFGDAVLATEHARDGIPTLWVARDRICDLLTHLKTGVDRPYRMLYDLTAIDERMRVHRPGQPASDFTVVYHLLSFDRNETSRISVGKEAPDAKTVSFDLPIKNSSSGDIKPALFLGSVSGNTIHGIMKIDDSDVEFKAVKLPSAWQCSNHKTPHIATTEEEMRTDTMKYQCAGWHKVPVF